MAKRKGLGRGLNELLTTKAATDQQDQDIETGKDSSSLKQVPVDQIQRGEYQPRMHFEQEALQELADSIKAQGVIQPVVVRRSGSHYELIAGERRWRATQLAGLQAIPAVVRDIPDQTVAAMSLIENIQREDLSPLEEANALQRLINEFGLTHQQAADTVGRSRAAVSNLLRLIELEPEVKALVDERQLEMGHARALLGLSGGQQLAAAKHVAGKGMSVRETERYVKQLTTAKDIDSKPKQSKPSEVRQLESDIGDRLGAKVSIEYNDKGKGKVVINYNSLDELDGILAHIK